MSYLEGFSPLGQALLATLFTWGVTALGAALVLLTPRVNQRLLDAMNGFAAGVMLAASYWSLLAPAIAMSERDTPPGMGSGDGGLSRLAARSSGARTSCCRISILACGAPKPRDPAPGCARAHCSFSRSP